MDGVEEHKFDNGQTIDQAVESFSGDLGLGDENPAAASPVSPPVDGKVTDADPQGGTQKAAEVVPPVVDPNAPKPREVPKSWPKEAHDYWSKLDPKVQELVEKREADFHQGIEQYKGDAGFAKSIKDVIAPYQALIDSSGVKADAAIKGLLNAHYQLSQGNEDQRTAFMATLIKGYRIDPAKLAAAVGDTPLSDPALKPLQDQINNLTTQMTTSQRADLAAKKAQIDKEVEAFSSDPANIYFADVAQDMAVLIQGSDLSMKEAYERAVRANPATWAKEEARLRTEIEAKVRKEADDAAAKARKAKGTNVRGSESTKSPTDPIGSMDDTMKEVLADIKSRT